MVEFCLAAFFTLTYLLTYSLNYLLTYSMVQSPSWEANWFAASQGIPRISRNPKVHYRTHKRPPPVSILGQPNPVHIPTTHLLEIRPNIIHPTTIRLLFQYNPNIRYSYHRCRPLVAILIFLVLVLKVLIFQPVSRTRIVYECPPFVPFVPIPL